MVQYAVTSARSAVENDTLGRFDAHLLVVLRMSEGQLHRLLQHRTAAAAAHGFAGTQTSAHITINPSSNIKITPINLVEYC